jgi:hypothetical protein
MLKHVAVSETPFHVVHTLLISPFKKAPRSLGNGEPMIHPPLATIILAYLASVIRPPIVYTKSILIFHLARHIAKMPNFSLRYTKYVVSLLIDDLTSKRFGGESEIPRTAIASAPMWLSPEGSCNLRHSQILHRRSSCCRPLVRYITHLNSASRDAAPELLSSVMPPRRLAQLPGYSVGAEKPHRLR